MFQIPGFLEEPQISGRLEILKVDMKPIKNETEGRVSKIPQILYKYFSDIEVHWSIQYILQ
jgi:hypothetical protein